MKSIIKRGFLLIGLTVVCIVAARAQTACKCWLHIDSSFQIAPMTLGFDTDVGVPPLYENDNATTPAMALPFNFCFYGRSFDSGFISNNGIVSFTQPIHNFIDSTQQFPLGADTMIIAPFYADAYTRNNGGLIYYKITSTSMVVIWDSVRYTGTDVDGWNTFQLIITDGKDAILPEGNNVSFCYPVMQWACSDASGGFSGYGGTPAFVGINKGDGTTYAQISTFSLPGNVYDGPFSTYNGVDWLDFQSFTLNACVTGNVIPPVIANDVPICHTMYICPCDTSSSDAALGAHDSSLVQPCDTVNITAAFICAVPGQNSVLSYSVSGALNIDSVNTSTANFIDSITVQVIPAFGDTGTHTLSLTATDTVGHLQSTVTYKIIVTSDCRNEPPPPNGIIEIKAEGGFSVYPNPADKTFTIKMDNILSNATVRVYDVFGAEVFSGPLISNPSDIDISGLARGLYFVELFRAATPLSVKKIIIQ